MVRCLRLGPPPLHTLESVELEQGKIHEALGGKITFVGAIPQANAFVVARRECDPASQEWEGAPPSIFCETKFGGDVVLFASNDRGEEEDLDVEAAATALREAGVLLPDHENTTAGDVSS
jgi:hypothetical protein